MDPSAWTISIVGSISAVLTTAAFVPQVVRVWRLRDARDTSLPTFAIFSVGLIGWLVYGLLVASIPIVAANAVTFGLAVAILGLKIQFDHPAPRPVRPAP
jgi:MtN3 and saliva related transmembrane protein